MNVSPSYWTPDRIRALRDRLGYDQAEFAALLGVSRHALERYEAGADSARRLHPNDTVCRLLALLDHVGPATVRRLKVAVGSVRV